MNETIAFTIGAPAAPTATVTTQPSCAVPTGTITVTAPTGSNYEYSIDGVTYQAGTAFSSLAPGSYNVTVRDNVSGCVSSATTLVVDPIGPSTDTDGDGTIDFCDTDDDNTH